MGCLKVAYKNPVRSQSRDPLSFSSPISSNIQTPVYKDLPTTTPHDFALSISSTYDTESLLRLSGTVIRPEEAPG